MNIYFLDYTLNTLVFQSKEVITMKRKYGIVLIGCGHMGETHIKHAYCKDNVTIVGVVDIIGERAKAFALKYGASSYSTDYESYLMDDNVDIVIIATYPSTHLEIIKNCLKHGKHIICEKPIADTLEKGIELLEIVKNSKSKLLVGHILRYNESYKRIYNMIADGAIGSPIIMRMVQNHHTMDWPKYKKLIEETSPIIDCGVHYIDVMRWFTGAEITEVSGICQKTEMDLPDGKYNYGMITVKLSDGSVGFYEAGWGNTIRASNVKEFIGPKGRISLTYKKDRHTNQEEGDLIEYYMYPEKEYKIININCDRKPADLELDKLINMIENDEQPVPSFQDVFNAFNIAIMADKSIKDSTMIKMTKNAN